MLGRMNRPNASGRDGKGGVHDLGILLKGLWKPIASG